MQGITGNIKVLTENEIEAIHRCSVNILEKIGIKVPNDEVLDICKKMGAEVDYQTSMLRIPIPLMEEVLKQVRKIEAHKNAAITGDSKSKIRARVSTQIFMVDYKTKFRRYGLLDDVMKGIALLQHMDNFRMSDAITIPSDVPYNMTDVVSYQKIYTYSKKPGETFILSPTGAKYIIQMAKLMNRKVEYLLETISPLQYMSKSLEMALIFAKEGQKLVMGPMVMSGATGPMTLAGTVALSNAECLGGLFLTYALTNDTCPYTPAAHSIDMKTMLCSFGSPNQALLGIASAQMGSYYGLRVIGSNSGLTDAIYPDFQGGCEKLLNAVCACMAGTSCIGGQGLVGADQGVSLEQIVIDNEWIGAFNYIMDGVEVSEETIAAELIEKVGVGGNFISEEHTIEHLRENYWPSRLFERLTWDNWIENQSTLVDRAHDYVENVISGYQNMQPIIDNSLVEELSYITKCAGEELANER